MPTNSNKDDAYAENPSEREKPSLQKAGSKLEKSKHDQVICTLSREAVCQMERILRKKKGVV
jgi:hypothetical protein